MGRGRLAALTGFFLTIGVGVIAVNSLAKEGPSAIVDHATDSQLPSVVRDQISHYQKKLAELRPAASRAYILPSMCQGRLTLTSGTAVTTSDVTAASTVYFTPYQGSYITLYNGSTWVLLKFTEVSIALSGLTSGDNYDVFAYNASGTVTLELSSAWASDTARTDILTTVNGVNVKNADNTRRYLGTIRTTATTTTEDSQAKRFVWNYYNRVPRFMKAVESTSSWVYNTASWRSANGSTSNQLQFVVGLNESLVRVTVLSVESSQASGNYTGAPGIGLDSTTAPSSTLGIQFALISSGRIQGVSEYRTYSGIGYHFLQWLEYGNASGATFYGTNGVSAATQAGIVGMIEG